jgi:hypothetical protein
MHTPKLISVLVLLSFIVSYNLPVGLALVPQPFAVENLSSNNGLPAFQVPELDSELRINAYIDLVASGMQVRPNPATQGEPMEVQVRVTNQGTISAGTFTVQWWATWAVVGCTWTVASLAPGASRTLECTDTYPGWNNGYLIKEVVDPDNAVAEVREANNSRTATLRVWDAP